MTKAIEAIGLTKYYDGQVALEGLDLEVEEGEVFGFLGPNGAGKTTTIRLLTGLSKPKSGVDHVLGYDIRSDIVKAKRGFGVVPELSNMYDELSGLENLVFMAQLYGVPFRERRARAEELLKTFGLYERKDSKFAAYSRGMKRALTIAAALVHRPRLLFLDEPTVGLDVVAARSLRALIQQLHGERITVFLTTHYPEEADTLSDRIALLVKGRMIAVGTPAKLKAMTNERAALEVSFKTSLPRAADELKEKLPNAELVQVDHRLRIYGGDTTAVLEAVLGYARGNATEVASVTSHNPTLEDAFVKLTGLPSKVMVAEKGGAGKHGLPEGNVLHRPQGYEDLLLEATVHKLGHCLSRSMDTGLLPS